LSADVIATWNTRSAATAAGTGPTGHSPRSYE
jgi:hypothetical protein